MEQTVCYLLIYLAEAWIAYQYFESVALVKEEKRAYAGMGFLISYLFLYCFSFFDQFVLNSTSFFFVNFILLSVFFEMERKGRLFQSLLMTIVMIIAEILVVSVMGAAFSDFLLYKEKVSVLIIASIISKLIYYLLLKGISRIFRKKDDQKQNLGKVGMILCVLPVVSILIMFTLIYACINQGLTNTMEWLTLCCSVALLIANLLVFYVYSYNLERNRMLTETQLLLQKEHSDAEYYKLLIQHNENQNILLHDIKNHFQMLLGLLEQGDSDNATDYIRKIVEKAEFQHKNKVCNNTFLNQLMSYYLEMADKSNIRMDIDIRNGTMEFLTPDDMVSLFGNLLDNAIGAAKDGFIELRVSKEEKKETQMITIVNSCNIPPIIRKNGEFESTKEDKSNHGYGIKSIEKIVKKYNGSMKLYFDEEENTFHSIVLLNDK